MQNDTISVDDSYDRLEINIKKTSDTGNPAEERQDNVQEKGEATASLHEDGHGR